MSDFADYEELANEGGFSVGGKDPVDPKDEFFHSVYISGQNRKNQDGEIEKTGKLQVRGVITNRDEVNMVITHVKQVLVKTVKKNGKDYTECFSYQQGPPPWKGTSGRECGRNSSERGMSDYCKECKSQIIVAGLYIDETTGKPFMVDNKPVYVFIKGKGMKYGNVSSYLSDLVKKDDLDPIFEPVTEKSKKFEKENVNYKRFVTKITVDQAESRFGMKDVFKLETGSKLSKDAVLNILNKTKETLEQFKEKFDWSRNAAKSTSSPNNSNVSKDQQFNFSESNTENSSKKEDKSKTKSYSFEDVDF